jgi:hypothetical protein
MAAERAAISAARLTGRGNKIAADQAAVDAMRRELCDGLGSHCQRAAPPAEKFTSIERPALIVALMRGI